MSNVNRKMSINDKRESKHASKSNEVLTLVPKMPKFCSLELSGSFNVFLRSHMIPLDLPVKF